MKKILFSLFLLLFIANIATAGPIPPPQKNPLVNPMLIQDDFSGGTLTSGQIGDCGWSLSGTLTVIGAGINHPGTRQLDTGSTINTIAYLACTPDTTTGGEIDNDSSYVIKMVFKPNQITNQTIKVGLMNNYTADPIGDGVYMEHDTSDGTNPTVWLCVTENGAAKTETVTTTTVAASWLEIDIVKSGESIDMYINGAVACSGITTNLTGNSIHPVLWIKNLEAASKTMNIDYYGLEQKGISRY